MVSKSHQICPIDVDSLTAIQTWTGSTAMFQVGELSETELIDHLLTGF
jgi:hypothetical protein